MADSDKATGSPAPGDRPSQKQGIDPASGSTLSTTAPPAESPAASAVSRTSAPNTGHANRSTPQSSTRAPYVPQFSAATQMILKRMRGETGGLSSALASVTAAGAARPTFSQSAYESVRQQVSATVSSSSSSSHSSMPAPSSRAPSTPTPTPTKSATLPLPLSSSSPKPGARPLSTTRLSLAPGQKRKRGEEAGGSGTSSPAEASDYGEGVRKQSGPRKPAAAAAAVAAATVPTMTKSGRQVLKPDTYDPAAEDNARRRSRLDAARTTEQALCKRCTRMHSPASNQMVFCDGCNDPWHQRCHEPWIEDEVVRDPDVDWYCAVCAAKRERAQPRKKVVVVEKPRFGSWAGRPASQKRAYLSGLPQAELVNLLLRATELHPGLPIFPLDPTPKKSTAIPATATAVTPGAAATMPRSLFAGTSTEGLFPRGDANPTAPMNFIRKIPASAKKSTMAKARSGPGSLQSKADAQGARAASGGGASASSSSAGHQLLREDEDSSFTRLWPRPGKGMYSRLPPEAEDDRRLVDAGDYDAFSVIVFNEKGKKIEENGVKV